MIKFTSILAAFVLSLYLAHASPEEYRQQLTSHSAEDRAEAAYRLSHAATNLDTEVYQQLIDLLTDSERVIILKDNGQKRNTSPGMEARKTLIAAGNHAAGALGVGLIEQRPSIRWRLCDILARLPTEESIEALMNVLRVDPEKLVRNTAGESLAEIGEEALPFLIEGLHTGEPHVRHQIIWILSEMQDPKTIPLLLTVAMEKDSPFAGTALEALYKFGPAAVAPCLNILKNDSRIEARERAAFLLGRIDEPAATQGLSYVFLTEQNDRLRMICLQSLHRHDNPKLCDLLLNAITDPNPTIVAMAKPMLRKYKQDAAKTMLTYMDNLNSQIADIAFEGLISLGPSATPAYVLLAKNQSLPLAIRKRAAYLAREQSFEQVDPDDRLKCLFILQDWAGLAVFGDRFRDIYVKGAYSNDDNERFGSTVMLGELSSFDTLDVLFDKLSDRSPHVQDAAYYGLSKMGRNIQQDLVDQLNRRVDSSAAKIARLLAQFKFNPKNDIERILIYAANDRWEDMNLLGERAISYLLEQLQSADKHTTLWAAYTIARWHQHSSLLEFDLETINPTLYDLLDVKNSYKRDKAFDLLLKQANFESVSYLLVPLFIPEPEHTEIAAQKLSTLGVIGMEVMATALLSDIKDTYGPALATLELIGEPALPMLTSGLNHPKFKADILKIFDRMNYKPKTSEEEVAYLLATEEYESLVRMGNIGIRALIQVCAGPPSPKKIAIYEALQHGRLPEINQILLRALWSGTPSEQQAARASLLAIGESAIPQIRKLVTEGNFMQALHAARLLGAMDYSPINQEEYLWIGSVQQSRKVLIENEAEVLQLLSQNLLSDYDTVRQISTGTMAFMREQKGEAIKENTYELAENILENLKHENAEVRAESARLVAQYGPKAYHLIPALLELAKDSTPILINGKQSQSEWGTLTPAWFASQALVNMGSNAVSPFLETYNKATENEKTMLSLALSTMSDPRLVPLQRDLIYDSRTAVQQAAIKNLAQANDLESIPKLLSLVDANKAGLFAIIQQSIEEMGANAAPYVISQFDNAATSVERGAMASLLTRCTTPEAYQRIELFLKEANPNQAKTIYKLLREPDDQKSITLLISGLKSESWSVREAAADSLVVKGPKALPILIPALDVPDQTIRGYLRQILKLVTQKDFGNNNEAWKAWWKEQSSIEQKS